MAVNRRANGTYSVQYYVRGERFTVPGSFRTKTEAKRAAALAQKNHDLRPHPRKQGEQLLFAEAAVQMMKEIQVEANTKVGYSSLLNVHVLPALGDVPVEDISRRMLKRLFQRWESEGKSLYTIRAAKSVISNVLQMLVEDDRLEVNKARGIDVGNASPPKLTIPTQDDVARVLRAMPTEGARLWMHVQIGTGCRPNEIRALRPCDLNGRELQVRAVQNENHSRRRQGLPQFTRRPSTKNGDTRKITVGEQLAQAWRDFVAKYDIAPEEPLFTQRRVVPPAKPVAEHVEIPSDLGTLRARNGREYRHGTVNAYVTAGCRCDWCRLASRQQRRRQRSYTKAQAQWRNPDELVTEAQWRKIWKEAWESQGLGHVRPSAYRMRHTHASWLIDAGQNPVKVGQRLGHRDLTATQRYVRPVGDDGELADTFDALADWLVEPDSDDASPRDGVVDLRDSGPLVERITDGSGSETTAHEENEHAT